MNRTVIVVVCLAILVALLYYQEREQPHNTSQGGALTKDEGGFSLWQEFKPQSGLFKVLLPNPPQYAKDLVPIAGSEQRLRYDIYASEKIDGTLFLISVITYPEESDVTSSMDILKQTVEELKRSKPDNEMTKVKESLYHNHQALDFSMVNREFRVEGKAFIVDKIVYVLSYGSRKSDFNATEYEHFVNSFALSDHQLGNG